MSKHTPGPWTIGPRDSIWAGEVWVANVMAINCHPKNEEREANLNLIAAAPLLLKEIEKLVKEIEKLVKEEEAAWLDEARTVLAKAKGDA